MQKDTINPSKGQGSQHQSEVLAELCYQFVCPLLQALHAQMDRRLVHTFLDLLPVIVMHRHRNHGLLLSELGGYLLVPHQKSFVRQHDLNKIWYSSIKSMEG